MGHEVTISVGDERGHFLIPGIVNLNASQITFYSIWLRSFRGCAVMYMPYDG